MTDRKRTYSSIAFACTVTFVLIIGGLYFYNIIRWINYPNFGIGFRTATGIKEIGYVFEHGKKAGLQIGDRIISVNGKDYKNFRELCRGFG